MKWRRRPKPLRVVVKKLTLRDGWSWHVIDRRGVERAVGGATSKRRAKREGKRTVAALGSVVR